MKNLILVSGLILSLCIAAGAQEATQGVTGMGLKLGFGFANISTDYDELDEFLDSRTGFSGGAFLTYNLNRQLAVQPEVLYVSKGAEKDLFIITPAWAMDYLEIPVLLKFAFTPDAKVRPNLFAGPAFALLLSSEVSASDYSFDVADGMKSMDVGFVLGGGLDFKRFTFDIRYTLGLVNVIDADKINELTESEEGDYFYLEGDPSVKNTNISFMFGVRF